MQVSSRVTERPAGTVQSYCDVLRLSFSLGESGLGKSTLLQSLFLTNFFSNKDIIPAGGTCCCCVGIIGW